MERPKAIHLKKILGLTPDCDGDWYHYKYRNQWADYQETEKFYKQFPPEVGQTVVVLRTFYTRNVKASCFGHRGYSRKRWHNCKS